MKQRIFSFLLCLALIVCFLCSAAGCTQKVRATELMGDIYGTPVSGKTTDEIFAGAVADFSVGLLQKVLQADGTLEEGENALLSPVSAILALAMTANGAEGDTKREMETVLGGDIPLEELNEYLYTYVQELPSEEDAKLHIANSIWFREDRIQVDRDFLQKNADYYSASVYQAPFHEETVKDINLWVERHTDGMIDRLVEHIPEDTVMYLVNALAFDAEWKTPFFKGDVCSAPFYPEGSNGDSYTVDMMYGEAWKYIENGDITGFIKPYLGDAYSFAALLPAPGETTDQFVASLTGERLLELVNSAEETPVQIALPKFQCTYGASLADALIHMGMPSAFTFTTADFSGIGTSEGDPLYISDVWQKTHISVDVSGTKAAAATVVEVQEYAAVVGPSVILERPFVYMILDNTANLPLFIGVVNSLSEEY